MSGGYGTHRGIPLPCPGVETLKPKWSADFCVSGPLVSLLLSDFSLKRRLAPMGSGPEAGAKEASLGRSEGESSERKERPARSSPGLGDRASLRNGGWPRTRFAIGFDVCLSVVAWSSG